MRLHRGILGSLIPSLLLAPTLSGQLVIGATAGAVHYDGQSTITSFALNPEVRYERRGLVLDASSGWTAGSDGGRVVDGSALAWAATPPAASHVQLDGLVQFSGTAPRADSSSSELFALGEIAYALEHRGFAAGLGTVQSTIQGTPSVGAFRAEVRGWYATGDLTVTGSLEPTSLQGSWFVEYAGGAEWTPGDFDLTAGLRLRQVSGAGLTLGGTGSASWDVTRRWAVELDAGRYLRDPFQGLPAGYFISLGVRLKIATWKEGTGEGVGAASLGDLSLKAGLGRREVSQLPAPANGNPGRGNGNGHRP